MVEYFYGKPLDIMKLKGNIQKDYKKQVKFWKKKASVLYEVSKLHEQCDLCKSKKYNIVGKIHGWPWHQCEDCSNAYIGRRVPDEKLIDIYDTTGDEIDYSETYTDDSVQEYRMTHATKPKMEFIKRFSPEPPAKWLDVGAGCGDLLYLAKQEGYQVEGIEVSRASVQLSKNKWNIDLFQGTFEQFQTTNNKKRDVITILGLLDLIPNPDKVVEKIYSMLAKQGTLAISVPNFDCFSTAVQFAFPDQVICRHIYPSIFLNVFTEEAITKFLNKCGFDIHAIWYFGMDVYEFINNMSILRDDKPFQNLIALLRKYDNDLQLIFDREKLSEEMFIIAQKKTS